MLTYLMSITKNKHKHILWHIYENYRNNMYYTAMSIVHDTYLAEDVVQASFERIIKKMHLIEQIPCNSLRSYTVLLVRSIAINAILKEHKYKLEPDEVMENMVGIDDMELEDLVINNEQVGIIRKCLNEIDEKYVQPMIFRYYYGFTNRETADLLGISSESTVRSLCYRGKKMIIKALREAGDIHELR